MISSIPDATKKMTSVRRDAPTVAECNEFAPALNKVLTDPDAAVRVQAGTAVAKIEEITAQAEVGKIYNGKVARIVDFGAFISILPGKDGLLHISQIAQERVEKVTDYLEEGQFVDVVVLDVDQRGRIKLSMKEVENYAA